MKNFFKNLLLYILIIFFVLNILKGINTPDSFAYLFATLLALSIGMLMSSPILNFLTVRENFITNLLMTFLVVFGLLYLIKLFMPGFYIEEYTFSRMEMGTIVVNSFVMVPMVTMALGAFVTSFMASLFSVLEKS